MTPLGTSLTATDAPPQSNSSRPAFSGEAPAPRPLLSPAAFAGALFRERIRSDRSGRPFSLVVGSGPPDGKLDSFAERLLCLRAGGLRAFDDVCLLDDRRIALLLPEMEAGAAFRFAAWLRSELSPNSRADAYLYDPRRRPDGSGEDLALPLAALFARPLPRWKRLLDIVVAGGAILCAAPLIITAALAVRLTSPGPALFIQQRAGLGGRPFRMCKLRTMRADAEERKKELLERNEQDGPAFKLSRDPRVTPLGRFLRATSIDELPQLWNVLRGDMSLVGPRPLPCDESSRCRTWQLARLDVTPGITCIWQVQGRSRVSFDEWMRMDVEYVRRRSPAVDLKLLWETVPAVLSRKGAK